MITSEYQKVTVRLPVSWSKGYYDGAAGADPDPMISHEHWAVYCEGYNKGAAREGVSHERSR